MVDIIARQYPKIKIVLTANLAESLLMLSRGEVDATFGVDVALLHAMNNTLIHNVKFINQTKYSTESLHFMSRKDRPLLHSILNKSLFSIPQAKKNEIIKKWTVETELKKVIETGKPILHREFSIELPSSPDPVYLIDWHIPIKGEANAQLAIVSVVLNVTELKEIQKYKIIFKTE